MAPMDDDTSSPERSSSPLAALAAYRASIRTAGARLRDDPRVRAARGALARLLNRYPPLPPGPDGLWPRIAMCIVGLMAVVFAVFFSSYLFAQHDAFLTHAEDLGIMDQALWNTLHGAPLHQTICNIVTDTNCLGDVSRLAIHFEPILFPLSLLYLVAPSPKTLQFVQAVIVASGAFPAFALAWRRLRSPFAGLVFAAAYLLFPALQAAVTYDFHAVTLSAAFLLFALYFMLARNNLGLIAACLLALATKEEIPIDVALIGLSVALLQRRPRLGWGLVGLAAVWLGGELVIMHLASPLGHSPTASRYAQFGDSPGQVALYLLAHPLQVAHDYIFSPDRIYYLRTLLSPLAYLPLFAPLTLLIAVPALAINMLSASPAMYSGIYQYNAEIVPVLIVATIESIALLSGLGGWIVSRTRSQISMPRLLAWRASMPKMSARRVFMVMLTVLVLILSLRAQRGHGYTPLAQGFAWPSITAHARLAERVIARIPADASVSAQSDLVPHLSHRRHIYMFPYHMDDADYIFLDVTGNLYPQTLAVRSYIDQVRLLLTGGRNHVVFAEDGYLLLAKGSGPPLAPADPWGLPPAFYSFTVATPGAIPHATAIRFGGSLELVGYDVSPAPVLYVNNPYLTVTTYWRVERPMAPGDTLEMVFTRSDGSAFTTSDFATVYWRPLATWRPGEVIVVRSWPLLITSREVGTLRLGARVMHTGASGARTPLPVVIGHATGLLPIALAHNTVGVFDDIQVMG